MKEGSAISNADVHRQSADLFNARDWSTYADTLAENCEAVDQARGVTAKGRQQCVEFEQAWVTAFPDGMMTSAQVIDGGSSTVLLFTGSGRNDGPLGPLPATGRQVSMPFCEVRQHDADGRVTRSELFYDQITMLVQLGHLPPPEG